MERKGSDHKSHLPRVRRVEGQIRGISKMIEEKRYCIDILTQIKAVKSALSSLESNIIEEHLNHCVHKAIAAKNSKETDKMLKEIKDLLKKSSK